MFLDFAWVTDPTAWGGLGTLIILEIVLGIDNLVFISILASRLPQKQRKNAFKTGLGLALLMRLVLLSTIAWVVSLTNPWFTVFGHSFTARDIILIIGGLFLLFKGTMELHARLEGAHPHENNTGHHAKFWQVIVQILVLDSIFSLDSVITSVGMVQHLSIMMLAVIVAIFVMLLASGPLTRFVEKHPTVVVLCLGFLLMIGLSLVLDGVGIHIPKGYLYAAIAFSIVIEACNQLAVRKRKTRITARGLRESTATAVLGLLGGKGAAKSDAQLDVAALAQNDANEKVFSPEESAIVASVIRSGGKTARSIMIPRTEAPWVDSDASPEEVLQLAGTSPYSQLPVIQSQTDEVLGILDLREALWHFAQERSFSVTQLTRNAPMIFEHALLPELLDIFRQSPGRLSVVVDEYGSAVGFIRPEDILCVLAGTMGETLQGSEPFRQPDGSWVIPGRTGVEDALRYLGIPLSSAPSCSTLAGFLLHKLGHIPEPGEQACFLGYTWTVLSMDGRRIGEIRIRKTGDYPEAGAASEQDGAQSKPASKDGNAAA